MSARGAVVLAIAAAALTACGGSKVSPPDTGPTSGAFGASLVIDGPRGGEQLTVRPLRILDAQPARSYDQPHAGSRWVAVQFTLNNSGSGSYSDGPSNGASLVLSSGRSIESIALEPPITAGRSLPSLLTLKPGGSARGYITFELPTDATVAKVRFRYGEVAEWAR